MTKFASMISAAAMFSLVAASAVQAQSSCVGDCSNTRTVHVNDLVLGVDIALGTEPVSKCPAFDCLHNNMVTVACLIQGVNNALNGCPGGPTSTPMQTGGATPTATPSPSPSPSAVERIFNVDTSGLTMGSQKPYGICSGMPSNTQCQDSSDCPSGQTCSQHAITGVFSSANGGGNAAVSYTKGPLVLELGAPDASGIAKLSLKEDTSLKATTIIATCVCLKFLAATSTGQMYCGSQIGGGPKFDTEIDQGPGPGTDWTVQTGLGSPSNPGDGNLLVTTRFQYIDNTGTTKCSTVDCSDDSVYGTSTPNQFAFTTTTATAVKMLTPPPNATLSAQGQAFDCANFATPGIGRLASGAAATIVLPSADVFRIAEKTP